MKFRSLHEPAQMDKLFTLSLTAHKITKLPLLSNVTSLDKNSLFASKVQISWLVFRDFTNENCKNKAYSEPKIIEWFRPKAQD